jgi:DNA-binding GntR family transcriptional regulator
MAVRRTSKADPLLADVDRPRRSVLGDSTYETVKQLIMDSRLAAGARISMDGLARDLDVSPTPVREALARLDAEGLVSKRPLAGYTVSPLLDPAAFEDLFRLRLLLEPEAARLAAGAPAPADRTDLTQALATIPTGAGYPAYREQVALDARFHDTIAAAGGSPLLHEAISRLRAHLHLYRLYRQSDAAVTMAAETAAEHHRIVRAITAGDPAAAAEAMRAHLQAAHDRLVRFAGRSR